MKELEERYKKETGKDAIYEMESRYNAGRYDDYYYDDYVLWLEELIEKLTKDNDETTKSEE